MSTETSTHQPANPYPLDDNVSGDTGFREQKSVLASRVSEVLHAYLALTKPRIIELLLITTVPAMVAAQRGIPRLESIVATVLGGTLSAGGANAINNYFDRDIDERMARTQRRPLPSHKIIPRDALVFGIVLGTAGFLVLGAFTNWLAAFLATAALVFYVVVYTLILKRRTPQNIVIGGAAGGVPALVGWAAVRGRIEVPAVVLFFLVFYWTPPHFWALAIKYKDDYEAAEIPMLPVTRGISHTASQILLYSWLTVATSLLYFAVGGAGVVYLVSASVLGGELVRRAYALRRLTYSAGHSGSGHLLLLASGLFKYSNVYLALLSAAIIVDVLAGAPRVAG